MSESTTDWSKYVRSVTLVDDGGQDSPVHVTTMVLLDGVLAASAVPLPITVDAGPLEPTVITMHFRSGDITIGTPPDPETGEGYTPWMIGDREVLVPVDDAYQWEVIDDMGPDNPDLSVVACAFYVGEIHFQPSAK